MHPRRWLVFLASTLTLLSVAAIASETKTDINTDYPLLPLVVAEPGTWAPNQTDYVFFGDVRAVLNVTSSDQSITAQIFWRRRDKNPGSKLVIVTDAEHNVMPVLVQQITQECGFVTFSAKRGPGVYYVYYMPYYQYDQSGFQTHFHWYNCSEHVEQCEMSIQSDLCTTVMEPANVTVVELQGRSVFYGPTQTELIALPNEIAAVTDRYKGQPFIAVAESRGNSIRMMGGASQVPAEWARRSTSLTSLTDTAWIGEFWTFQVALFAAYGPIDGVAVSVSDGVANGASIPSSAVNCFNLNGNDVKGRPFAKQYGLDSGRIGVLWFGVDVPTDAQPNDYSFVVNVTAANAANAVVTIDVVLTVTPSPSGGPVPFHGDGDIDRMTRLRWLDSTLGVDDDVNEPFIPVTLQPSPVSRGGVFTVGTLTKRVAVDSETGFPASVSSLWTKSWAGKSTQQTLQLLAAPISFDVVDTQGHDIPLTPVTSNITKHTDTGVYWETQRTDATSGLTVTVSANLEFDSVSEFNVTLTATKGPVSLSDARLTVPVNKSVAGYAVGMGTDGGVYFDRDWRWADGSCSNRLWLGQAHGGVWLALKGAGDDWNSPMDGKPRCGIPFIPTSWGGATATQGATGVNVTSGTVVAFSGARTLEEGDSVSFLFDMAFTPSHPVNMTKHWKERYYQVGYNCGYESPQNVAAMGATVVTLHQGTPGIINGSMVNPHINYPFLNDTVPLIANYTREANALGIATKFYYTIRELSSHAVELYALLSLQGEVVLDRDPYPEWPTFCLDWDCHGGAAWLHEHVATNYSACWQQPLADGEVDAAVCDTGVLRWFNYYVEGLKWSISQSPYIDGVYYDGINFDRHAMRRIRKAADQAAKEAGNARPLLDVHTGRDNSPPAVSYLPLFPYLDSVWNGEGFNFGKNPGYWLVEISGLIHGMSGDRLGGGASEDFKGMLFGMTQRNYASAPALWKFWDAYSIVETDMIGWWEDEVPVTLTYHCVNGSEPDNMDIHATSYVAYASHTIISIGSWCPTNTNVTLTVDWAALGMAQQTSAVVPAIEGMQDQGVVNLDGPVTVNGGHGVILVLSPQQHDDPVIRLS